MKRLRIAALLAAIISAFTLFGCELSSEYLISADEDWSKSEALDSQSDNAGLYSEENDSVIAVYLTVGKGNSSEKTDHTWNQVNSYPLEYYSSKGIEPYSCEAVVQIGDEAGPVKGEFGYGERSPNATVRIRGESASKKPQKSYRITIKDGKGSLDGQKSIILNKHSSDPLRIKNRLGAKLMQNIPGTISVRTKFVHLYVKDKTEGEDGLFEDYGLYTQTEQINKTYLKNHGLDKDGQLYKAEDFDWSLSPALIPVTDPQFSLTEFEKLLEVKGNQDNSKLISLIKAVNNPDIAIEETVNRYFDSSNLYNWLAFRLLTGSRESAYTDYYLYSSQMSDKWYFISANNDGILNDSYERLKDPEYTAAGKGIFAFSQNRLFSRILRSKDCRAELDKAVESLINGCLSKESVEKTAEEYAGMVKPYVYSLPDRIYARVTEDDYDMLADRLSDEVMEHYNEYKESLGEPWPFHINPPQSAQDGLLISWEESFIYDSSEVRYTIELAKNADFSEQVLKMSDIADTSVSAPKLSPGQYFIRVRANAAGAEQYAYEKYYTELNGTAYGTVCFYVNGDGGIEVSEFE